VIERGNELANDIVEFNRATIGERVFIAERAGVGGRNVVADPD
jgi:dihydropteroate synthase